MGYRIRIQLHGTFMEVLYKHQIGIAGTNKAAHIATTLCRHLPAMAAIFYNERCIGERNKSAHCTTDITFIMAVFQCQRKIGITNYATAFRVSIIYGQVTNDGLFLSIRGQKFTKQSFAMRNKQTRNFMPLAIKQRQGTFNSRPRHKPTRPRFIKRTITF